MRYCDLHHTINIEFKDNKMKVDIIEFTIKNQYTGNIEIGLVGTAGLSSRYIFDKKGKLREERIKTEVEDFFNSFIKSISPAGENVDNDW